MDYDPTPALRQIAADRLEIGAPDWFSDFAVYPRNVAAMELTFVVAEVIGRLNARINALEARSKELLSKPGD